MIDVSMLESMLSLTLSEIQLAQFPVPPPGRPIFGPIATKDGYINLSIASERTFQNLATASGHPRLDRRPALCAIPRPARQLGRADRRAGDLVERADRQPRCRRSSTATACRPRPIARSRRRWTTRSSPIAARSPRSTMRGGTFRALNPPFRMSGRRGRGAALCRRARRAHRGGAGRARLHAGEIAAFARGGITASQPLTEQARPIGAASCVLRLLAALALAMRQYSQCHQQASPHPKQRDGEAGPRVEGRLLLMQLPPWSMSRWSYTGIVRFWWARPMRAVSSRWPAMTRTPSSSFARSFSGVPLSRKAMPLLAAGGEHPLARLLHLGRVGVARHLAVAEREAEIARPQLGEAEARARPGSPRNGRCPPGFRA